MSLGIVVPYWNFGNNPDRIRLLHRTWLQVKHCDAVIMEFCPPGSKPLPREPFRSVTIFDGDIMWQKERLINMGARFLDTKYFMYIDADSQFVNIDWYDKISESLEIFDIVQCHSQCFYRGGWRDTTLFTGNYSGGSWAYPKGFRLFECAIVGGGDTITEAAILGERLEGFKFYGHLNNAFKNVIDNYYVDVRGHTVGIAGNQLVSGEHGGNPQYVSRWPLLRDFDPSLDIMTYPTTALKWATCNFPLHERVRQYFRDKDQTNCRTL